MRMLTRRLRTISASLALAASVTMLPGAHASGPTVTTFAGGGAGDGSPALSVGLNLSGWYEKSAIGPDGLYYFSQAYENRIRRLEADGTISTVAGRSVPAFTGDGGPATGADVWWPSGIAFSPQGELYFSDTQNRRIRKIDPQGNISTFAGSGSSTFSGDGGPATSAGFGGVTDLAFDSLGRLLLLDTGAGRVRRIELDGTIHTIAGNGAPQVTNREGPATQVKLTAPWGIAIKPDDTFYVADSGGSRIVHVDAEGYLREIAGSLGRQGSSGDGGPAKDALLSGPTGLSLSPDGELFISDGFNHKIRKISSDGVISTFAGVPVTGYGGYGGDGGPAVEATLRAPADIEARTNGSLIIQDSANGRIRSVNNGVIDTIAGTGAPHHVGDGGQATKARLNMPTGVAIDSRGNTYVADLLDHRVRKIATDGIITTIAGTGVSGFSGDGGPGAQAQISGVWSLAVNQEGELLIADSGNHRIRKIDQNGIITTIAGGVNNISFSLYVGDGLPAVASSLIFPHDVAVARDGSIYIADWGHNRVRKIDKDGLIWTVAGGGECCAGMPADGTPAFIAKIQKPTGVDVDESGRVYFVENIAGGRVWMIDEDGYLRLVAGSGALTGQLGDGGAAKSARLRSPIDVSVASDGSLFISDTGNHRLRYVSQEGSISTYAGSVSGLAGDGLAVSSAMFRSPHGLDIAPDGSLLIADASNYRVRRIA